TPRRQLIRMFGGRQPFILARDDGAISPGIDYQVIVEAVGSRLRVYQRTSITEQPALVFDVTDPTHERGAPALYCAANPDARFSDIRLDDFRDAAPVAYRFSFTTSRFTDFF